MIIDCGKYYEEKVHNFHGCFYHVCHLSGDLKEGEISYR